MTAASSVTAKENTSEPLDWTTSVDFRDWTVSSSGAAKGGDRADSEGLGPCGLSPVVDGSYEDVKSM